MSRDQAASLRAWALDKAKGGQASATGARPQAGQRELVIAGLPGLGLQYGDLVTERLQRWADRGFQWVGDPGQWRFIALAEDAVSTVSLARQCKHWALWVETDIRAFEKGYQGLKLMQDLGAPKRVLALHEPGLPRKGLLDNLANTAAAYCGIDLVVLAI